MKLSKIGLKILENSSKKCLKKSMNTVCFGWNYQPISPKIKQFKKSNKYYG